MRPLCHGRALAEAACLELAGVTWPSLPCHTVGHTLTNPADAQARAAAEADLTLTLPGGVPMYFRRIPACPHGFLMGERGGDRAAEPIHRVVIPSDFWLGTFPVTQVQHRAVVEAWGGGGLDAWPSRFNGDYRPVEQVSWDDATAWHTLLRNHWAALDPVAADGQPFLFEDLGLPNEAQWEYACRGKAGEGGGLWSRTEYHTGDGEARLSEAGWFGDNSKGSTHEVGEKSANDFGLYDMHGNLWEWCEDVWDRNAYRKREDGWEARVWTLDDAASDVRYWGEASTSGKELIGPDRVIRGGAWESGASFCQSVRRHRDWSDQRYKTRGFRVCLILRQCVVAKLSSRTAADGSEVPTSQRSKLEGSGPQPGPSAVPRGQGPTLAVRGVSDAQG